MGTFVKTDFYVYLYFRPDGITPCYVGKGHGKRWRRHERETRNPHLARIIKAAGGRLPKIKISEGLSEPAAFSIEMFLIKMIGREANGGPLVNMTDGGEGASGLSMEARAAISAKQKGKPKSPEACAAMRVPKGPMSEIHKAAIVAGQKASAKMAAAGGKISLKLKGVPKAEAHRIASGLGRRGIRHTMKARAKMSESAKKRIAAGISKPSGGAKPGHIVTGETRYRLSVAQKDKPKSHEAIVAATAARNVVFLAKKIAKQIGADWGTIGRPPNRRGFREFGADMLGAS